MAVCISWRFGAIIEKQEISMMKTKAYRTLLVTKYITYCRFGIRYELWMPDQIAEEVVFHILSSSCTPMT